MVLVQARWLGNFVDLDFETSVHRNPVLVAIRSQDTISTRHRHTRITETDKDPGVVVRGIVEPEFQPQVKVAELSWEVQESQFPGRIRLGDDQAVDQGKCATSCQLPFAE